MTGVLLIVAGYGVCAGLGLLGARWLVVRAQSSREGAIPRSDGQRENCGNDAERDAVGPIAERLLFRGIEWLLCLSGIVLLLPWAVAEGRSGSREAISLTSVAVFAVLVGVGVGYCRWNGRSMCDADDLASSSLDEEG